MRCPKSGSGHRLPPLVPAAFSLEMYRGPIRREVTRTVGWKTSTRRFAMGVSGSPVILTAHQPYIELCGCLRRRLRRPEVRACRFEHRIVTWPPSIDLIASRFERKALKKRPEHRK